MSLQSTFTRALSALVVAVGLVALPTTPASASVEVQAARVLYYDASQAAEFRAVVDRGAQIWNQSVVNVRFVPGTPANVRIIADDGWPRAYVSRLGNGVVYMGRQATAQGYNATRIASHELGHILGLPDVKPGPCSSLMSGSSAGVSCTNPYPNAAERSKVEANFSSQTFTWQREFVG